MTPRAIITDLALADGLTFYEKYKKSINKMK